MSFKKFLAIITIPAVSAFACADVDDGSGSTSGVGPEQPIQDPDPSQGGSGGTEVTPASDPDCPHQGPPVIDPASLQACPSYVCEGGGHCVPKGLLPNSPVTDQLADCNKDMACVPDIMIETNGNFLLNSCTAILGAEGRCLSACIPMVRERADFLERDTCLDHELCVPCIDPLTNDDTTVCNLTCDPGPQLPPPEPLPSCCPGGDGTCLPADLLPPEAQGGLAQESCPNANDKCVPNEMLDLTWVADPCQPDIILQLLGIDDGACIPSCADAVQGIGSGSCSSGYKCAPCDVFGDPTGACDGW